MENIWTKLADEAYKTRQERIHLEKVEKNLFEALKILSDNEQKSEGGFIFKYTVRKGPVDYQAVQDLAIIDLEQYRKPDVLCWKLERE